MLMIIIFALIRHSGFISIQYIPRVYDPHTYTLFFFFIIYQSSTPLVFLPLKLSQYNVFKR